MVREAEPSGSDPDRAKVLVQNVSHLLPFRAGALVTAGGKAGDIPQVYSRVCVGGEHEPSYAPGELEQIMFGSAKRGGAQATSFHLLIHDLSTIY